MSNDEVATPFSNVPLSRITNDPTTPARLPTTRSIPTYTARFASVYAITADEQRLSIEYDLD